ncbi:P-loop NTPase domain-containing protein LPA1 2-like [Salvia divinorum]|uniref:P-loop NTPase domain-containing protein LPA1 2-like n=1 Tax=Salvia divinorum TaxID=28513 RepID=A0ABD1GHQ2_SALDI
MTYDGGKNIWAHPPRNGIGTPTYGPLQIGKAEPVVPLGLVRLVMEVQVMPAVSMAGLIMIVDVFHPKGSCEGGACNTILPWRILQVMVTCLIMSLRLTFIKQEMPSWRQVSTKSWPFSRRMRHEPLLDSLLCSFTSPSKDKSDRRPPPPGRSRIYCCHVYI